MDAAPRRTARILALPPTRLPAGRLVELPGRGTTFVTDTPGPDADAPAVVLLHALACTGLLTWFPAIAPLATRFRVITLDQRWHGQGIRPRRLRLQDCADDVAALLDVLGIARAVVTGYSMGSVIAQRVWRQHPERVRGLVLAASTDRFRVTPYEQAFFGALAAGSLAAGSLAARTIPGRPGSTQRPTPGAPLPDDDLAAWAWGQFRSTPAGGVVRALTALGGHHSRPWVETIDVPTAVVAMTRDRVIPTSRQLHLAIRIPHAEPYLVAAGHAGCVLEAERFVPVLCRAVGETADRAAARD